METQKICIIGGGLTGLITAIVLSKLNLKVDLITGNVDQDIDNIINVSDIISMVNIILFNTNDYLEFWLSNLNNDDIINIIDLITLVGVILDNE